MAMIYCRECGYKHSSTAKACPKCGASHEDIVTTNVKQFFNHKYIVVYILFAVFFGIFGVHRFYAGKTKSACWMLALGILAMIFSFNIMMLIYLQWIALLPGMAVLIWVMYDVIVALCHLSDPKYIFENKK